MRGGERFYSQGGRPSQVFPYKEKSAGYSGSWCPRAPCRYLIGPGCRGSVSGSLASLQKFVRGIFPGHASTCLTFQELSTMTHLSWVYLHGMAHSFIELDHAVNHLAETRIL